MPLKLLVWNVQNFTMNKINTTIGDQAMTSVPGTSPVTYLPYNQLRSNYIMENIITADPDIFVIIEVISSKGVKGSLVSGKGAQGLFELANLLFEVDEDWCLVPALKLVDKINVTEIAGRENDGEDANLVALLNEGQYTEGIGVFYRKDRLDFVGPYVWPDTADSPNKKAVPPGPGITPGAYPDEWQIGLPDDNYYAGQYVFTSPSYIGPIEFPATQSRNPFLTRFVEKQGNRRSISLASVHFPPNSSAAETALARLAGYFVDAGIGDNEVQIIAGDYNLNFGEEFSSARYHLKGGYGFEAALGYGAEPTMLRRNSVATPTDYQPNLVLDNIAVRFGPNATEPNNQVAVLNRIGSATVPSFMRISLANILQLPLYAQEEAFRLPMNYGFLGPVPGTSDHLAIYASF